MPRPGSVLVQCQAPIEVPYSSRAATTKNTPAYAARARSPQDCAKDRHAEAADDVEPWQQREPGETPADRADRCGPGYSALANDPSDREPGQVHEAVPGWDEQRQVV